MRAAVDLSSDVGERPGTAGLAEDAALLEIITSANVACGGHAGDVTSMRILCALAAEHRVAVGAQVSFVDRDGFGRRRLGVPVHILVEQLREQWGSLEAATALAGERVAYMRPHGALYNSALVDEDIAQAIIEATPAGIPVLTIAGTTLARVARSYGHPVAAEIFADRAITDDGLLVPRGTDGAVVEDSESVRLRITEWLSTGHLRSVSGAVVPVSAESICIHSDTPDALAAARLVREAVLQSGARLVPFASRIPPAGQV